MAKLLLLLICASVLACASTPTPQTLPNLYQVRPGLWRSGQPTTGEHWAQVKALGVSQIVKLNFETEGSDDGGRALGITVYSLSIQPNGDTDVFDAMANTFVKPDPDLLARAQTVIQSGGGVLVHCTYGMDRTGLVIGQSRVLVDGWTKDRAYAEMLDRGFRPMLRGLREAWEAWTPTNL